MATQTLGQQKNLVISEGALNFEANEDGIPEEFIPAFEELMKEN